MGILDRLARLFQAPPKPPTAIMVGGHPADSGKPIRGPAVHGIVDRVWELSDADTAMREAESGSMRLVADMIDAMRGDGLIRGTLGTRGAGMWSLPVLFDGDPWIQTRLRGQCAEYDASTGACVSPRIIGMWERLIPLAEVGAVVEDGIMAGVGIGYMCDDPLVGGWRRLKRLDLQWLTYRHHDDSWWYQDATRGAMRVTPGDGRWVMFTPYGRNRPWVRGAWFAVAKPFAAKHGAVVDRTRWSRFLADGLRYIRANEQASEAHLQEMASFVRLGWGFAPGIALPRGYEPGIVESTGKGFEVYTDAEDRGDREIMVALAGQVVTIEGGKGFSSGDVWRDISSALIQTQAKVTAEWIQTEVIDQWTAAIGLGDGIVQVSWDVRDPSQRKSAADASKAAAESAAEIDKVAGQRGQRVKIVPFMRAHGVDVELEDLPATGTVVAS